MTNRNILNEADHLLVKHGVSELPLTMRKAEIIAQFSGWLLLTYDEGEGANRSLRRGRNGGAIPGVYSDTPKAECYIVSGKPFI